MSKKSIRKSSRAIDARSQQTLRRSLRLISSETIGKVSSLQLVDGKESVETHLGNLSEMSMKSKPRVGTHQTLLRRSNRFLPPEKLKPEISSRNSNFCMKSVEIHPDSLSITSQSKETASSRKIRAAIRGKSQLKLSRSKSGVVLEETQSGLRRSLRLSSQTGSKVFEIPQGFTDGNQRRQSMRLLGLAPVTAEHVGVRIESRRPSHEVEHNKPFKVDCKVVATRRSMEPVSVTTRARQEWNQTETIAESNPELVSVTSRVRKECNKLEAISEPMPEMVPKKECKPLSSQIRRSSPRFMSASNGLMKSGATLKMPDKVEVVAERLNADGRDLVLESGLEDAFVITKKADLHNAKRTKTEEHEMEDRVEKKNNEECCGTVAWNNEQEEALQKAYLIAKPSPHFWKKVSRMVPGKSAQECFDKIHASIATPLSSQPRPRTKNQIPSPITNFNFSANILPRVPEIEAGRLRRCRAKKLAAQKTVRLLLRKHRLTDLTKPADHFSLLESSPIKIAVNALNTTSTSPLLSQQSVEKFSANSKMLSRFKLLTSPDGPSPQVLKQIKNRALHDRYIDQLHHREARRVKLAKKSEVEDLGNRKCFSKPERGALKAARSALISDAKSFIHHFQHSVANPMDEFDADYSDDGDDDIDVGDLDE
ncbi:hypothetical protein KFK09_000318 [Dendrobium nobile]|uniref:Myb-like domain-containing protein n=1 Tax=Dendrobium nobile TaxID=94219 RepID=A0A8T3CEE3_DENNO|nr:hypothetical protein KFK09_000318 [Dendrobium nobile]